MDYLQKHKDTLAPELREVWEANGSRPRGTWEQVFGPGKPDSVDMPIQTTSPPMSKEEYESGWRKLRWPADEFFMAWNYARYVNKVVEEGKAEYNIPMFVNAWLQQPNMAWPGTYPSGGPLPQVHDVWRAGAPAIDILAPDLYVPYFDELCARFTRNCNPLFIPETRASAANALVAFGKFNAIGFSPFAIERGCTVRNGSRALTASITQMAPVIAAHRGQESITATCSGRARRPASRARKLHPDVSYIRQGAGTDRAGADLAAPGRPQQARRLRQPPQPGTWRARGAHGGGGDPGGIRPG